MTDTYSGEIEAGQRFEFGKNWEHFLSRVDEARIWRAERSLREMLGIDSLQGKTFLDIGCGSGAFLKRCSRAGIRCRGAEVASQRSRTSRRETRLTTSSRWFSSPAVAWSTTTPGR